MLDQPRVETAQTKLRIVEPVTAYCVTDSDVRCPDCGTLMCICRVPIKFEPGWAELAICRNDDCWRS